MRVLTALLLVALCLHVANAAVLLRFINTVPNAVAVGRGTKKNNYNAYSDAPAAPANDREATQYNIASSRVGLHYFPPSASGNNLNAETTVWTEQNGGYGAQLTAHGVSAAAAYTTANEFAYQMAMPPLRPYHDHGVGYATTVDTDVVANDRVARYYQRCAGCGAAGGVGSTEKTADDATTVANDNVDASKYDSYDRIGLKADGVGQYLTFAAGTYRMQAYGIMGATTAVTARPIRKFTTSASTFTFEDWKVYTLVATGNADWTQNSASAQVFLNLIEESTAATTFGKASLRFFHAIQSQSSQSIDVYSGATVSAAAKIVSGLNWQSFSAFVDVNPSVSQVFPLAYGSDNAVTTIATDTRVTFDVRAGTRATVICAINDQTDNNVFCRAIPSRVVAYVRLVNDLAGLNTHVLGKFGPQQVSSTPLSLWASYDYPRAAIQQETNQDVSNTQTMASPILASGLYPVIANVASNTVTGYGEVHVPLFIMDTAVRAGVVASGNGNGGVAANSDIFRGNQGNTDTGITNRYAGYDFSARFKRVNFIVKTDGFATVTDAIRTSGAAWLQGRDAETSTSTVDIPVEPGQYYTLFITPANYFAAAGANTYGVRQVEDSTTAVANPQNGGVLEFGWALDRSIEDLSQGITAGKARLRFMPFGLQSQLEHPGPNADTALAANVAGKLRQWGAKIGTYDSTTAAPAHATAAVQPSITLTPKASGVSATTGHQPISNYIRLDPNVQYYKGVWATDSSSGYLEVPAGEYTYSMVQGTTTENDKCDWALPAVDGDVVLADGDYATVYVLNWYGCKTATTQDPSQLMTKIVKESAASMTTTTTTTNAQETFFGAASSVSASIALLFAGILAVLAVF